MIGAKLLNFAFNSGLRRIFHKDVRAQKNVAMQFRLARTIATNRIDMLPRADHVIGQDRGILFVGRAGRDDVHTRHRLLRRGANLYAQTRPFQIARSLFCGLRIDVIKPDSINAQNRFEGQSLKLTLRAIADHRHRARSLIYKVFRGNG